MNKFDVIGFGALNVDKLFKVDKIAAAEEESFVSDYTEACGGSAANTMVGLARLGCKVGFIGKVGDDAEGRLLVKDFKKERVDTSAIKIVRKGRSGKAMGFVDQEGQRALYIDPGVNDTIRLGDIDVNYASKARFLHLTSFVGEVSFQTQIRLLGKLGKNVKVSFDPGVFYARMGMERLKRIVGKSFVMMPNSDELELLTGKSDYKAGAEFLIKRGVRVLAVKLGNKGCYATDGKEKHLVKSFKVKVVDTTGAGDAFDAGFLYGLLSGKTLYECAKTGNFIASGCILAMGARTSLPSLEDLEAHKQV
jgi:ribokinase